MKRSTVSGDFLLKGKIAIFILLFFLPPTIEVAAKAKPNGYVIAVRDALKQESDWMEVVSSLQEQHKKADVLFYKKDISELLPNLKQIGPRFLCVVDKPENIDDNFVIEGNRMCRSLDEDMYDDYLWGIVTGYTAQDALRIVTQSREPFVLRTALSTIIEIESGIWFDRMAIISDAQRGSWAEKRYQNDSVRFFQMESPHHALPTFLQKWEEIDPDIIITASHATQYNLEMPFSTGNLRSKKGLLYGDSFKPRYVPKTSKPRIYFPVGNCLIGDMDNSKQSMAAAWLSSGGATAMMGYVVSTWHGRNGWGALKFFLSSPGTHTLAEAAFLNRQDMYTQEYRKNPKLLEIVPDFRHLGERNVMDIIEKKVKELLAEEKTIDDVGFIYDRDVVVYYGDPSWNVRPQRVEGMGDYRFTFNRKGKRCTITLITGDKFSIDQVNGKSFKEEHVKDIPIGYFFPEQIFSPRLVENSSNLDIAFDENFLLIYNKDLKKNSHYTLVFELD
jgi:zinc protease